MPGETKTVVLSGSEFDTGLSNKGTSATVSSEVSNHIKEVSSKMRFLGFDLEHLERRPTSLSKEEAKNLFLTIHDAATILFMYYWDARIKNNFDLAFAISRLFNRLTSTARGINETNKLIDTSYIGVLEDAIKKHVADFSDGKPGLKPNHKDIVSAMQVISNKIKHENSWPWVVLPTFQRQHYGRIVRKEIKLESIGASAFIVQPTFNDNEITLFHTHGQNWAFSMPIGEKLRQNRHLNLIMRPASKEKIFPLKAMRADHYSRGDIIIIKPKQIHGIVGKRIENYALSIDEFIKLSDSEKIKRIKRTRFGNVSSLHLYVPDLLLAREFNKNPINFGIKNGQRFFDLYDMVMLNPKEKKAEVGGGGAWEQRCLATFGLTGEHCGICFVEKAARTSVPEDLVFQRFYEDNEEPIEIIVKT